MSSRNSKALQESPASGGQVNVEACRIGAAWFLLGLGVLSLAVGNVVFGESQPVPSLADMFYISGYPLLAMGLVGLPPSRKNQGTEPHWVLAAGITAIVGLVAWAFLILPSGDVQGVTRRLGSSPSDIRLWT